MRLGIAGSIAFAAVLAGCAVPGEAPRERPMTAVEGRAFVARYLPAKLDDRDGWAMDIWTAMNALHVGMTRENVCAVVAVTEQETNFHVDPPIPNLAAIAWKEIDRQGEQIGIPKLALHAALALPSGNGQSYSDRIDAARTEGELSEIFEDFIDRVPLGKRFLEERNPVRTAGPMQVSVSFARVQVAKGYPYPVKGSIRDEVFTRRGGLYFGIAHLLDYPAPYDSDLYRFADYNAGRYASRNAAFQNALAIASGATLDLDGDLLRFDHGEPSSEPGATELAARGIAARLGMSAADIRRDLGHGNAPGLEATPLYKQVFALADARSGKAVPRAMLPRIELRSPKITRKFTTERFARRVAERQHNCLARAT